MGKVTPVKGATHFTDPVSKRIDSMPIGKDAPSHGGLPRQQPTPRSRPKSVHRTTEPEVYGSEIAGPYALKGKAARRSQADIAADAAAERTVESPSYRAEQNARALSNPNLRDGIYGPNDPTTAADNNISKDAQSRIGGKTGGLY